MSNREPLKVLGGNSRTLNPPSTTARIAPGSAEEMAVNLHEDVLAIGVDIGSLGVGRATRLAEFFESPRHTNIDPEDR